MDKKLVVDGVETTFAIRKPKFEDTLAALKESKLNMDQKTGAFEGTAEQLALFRSYRAARCIVSPEGYSNINKFAKLDEDVAGELMSAVDELTAVPKKLNLPSAVPSDTAT